MGVRDSEKLVYQPEDGRARIHLWPEGKPVWLTQGQMAEHFQGFTQNTSLHIRSYCKDGELAEGATVKEYVTTSAGGKSYRTKRYHLGVNIAVGYRVRIHRGSQFRRWTTERLFQALFPDFFFAKCNKSRYSSYSKPAGPLPSMLNSGGPFFFREPAMKYTKAALTIEEQADKLPGRGLVAERPALINRLKAVNYYRLSGYLYPFRNPDDTCRSGTTLDVVWQRYTFDHRLRLLIMDPIERVEIALRSQLGYLHAHQYGAFGYEQPTSLPELCAVEHRRLLKQIDSEMGRSSEAFVDHFKTKYESHHTRLPIWSATEIMSLGTTLTFYRGVEPAIRSALAKRHGVAPKVLQSCVKALHAVRNVCAHHGRLWNRVLGVRPQIPRPNKHPDWHVPVSFSDDRIFAVLTVLKYFMNDIAPQGKWPRRLGALLDEHLTHPKLSGDHFTCYTP